jgi:hypothetical protein
MAKKYKFVCSLGFADAFGQTLLWLILIVLTLGLAIPFYMYFFLKLIINSTEIIVASDIAENKMTIDDEENKNESIQVNNTLIL